MVTSSLRKRRWLFSAAVLGCTCGGVAAAQTNGRPATLLPPTEKPLITQVRYESQPQQLPQLPPQAKKLPADHPPKDGLTLEKLLEIAAANNPELAAAHARADSARGRLIQAGLYINPRILWEAAMMSLNRGNSAGEQGPLFTQEIVTAHKIKLSEQAAASGVEAADWAAVTKQYDVITRVRLAYFE